MDILIPGGAVQFQRPREGGLSPFSGGYGERETPLPIPNRAVKPLSADGTWPARARESRSPPVLPNAQRAAPERGRRLEPALAGRARAHAHLRLGSHGARAVTGPASERP